jgi:hypothetical protein
MPPVLDPWSWRPSPTAWFELLGVLIANWEPAGGVGVDGESLRRFLLQAAAEQQLWLHSYTYSTTASN